MARKKKIEIEPVKQEKTKTFFARKDGKVVKVVAKNIHEVYQILNNQN